MGGSQSAETHPDKKEDAEKPGTGLIPEEVKQMTYSEFNYALGTSIKEDDLSKFAELWQLIYEVRQANMPTYDVNLVGDNVMKYLKYAFRHQSPSWREVGVRVCKTFFHLQEAREKLVYLDFIGSMMLLTMPEEGNEEDDVDSKDGAGANRTFIAEKQEEYQLLAADTILEMSDYGEFLEQLCSTSVLNFLCIALNQVPSACETVTHTFVKISANPENLPVFLAGSVGDILESFFKSTNIKRPTDEAKIVQWGRDISALAHCAHTMGTMIKYDFACQVDLGTIGQIFTSAPDSLRLIAELSRLFYWLCRNSSDVFETLMEAAPETTTDGLDSLLFSLVQIWDQCSDLKAKLEVAQLANTLVGEGPPPDLGNFLEDDLDRTKLIALGSDDFNDKLAFAEMRLCYMNCLLWEILPVAQVRWRLRDFGLKELHHAFTLHEPVLLQVVLGTIRNLVDAPHVQECHELIRFFGEQLLICLDLLIGGGFPDGLTRLLLDAISILALQRSMQSMLADYNIWGKLNKLVRKWQERNSGHDPRKIQLSVLRILSQVAVHPSHRLGWIVKGEKDDPANVYPPRSEFEQQLDVWIKGNDESFKTIASLLLTTFQEWKFQREPQELETIFNSILDWWQVNSTTRYAEEKEAAEDSHRGSSAASTNQQERTKPLKQMKAEAMQRSEEGFALYSMETLQYCAPYECVLALSLFSRLALEPKFKRLIFQNALEPLLGCICLGIWPEAREAAATLANLMWCPDLDRERLVCWLKMDGCSTVDAANVLQPVRAGQPKPVDIGKGMYRSTWGVEFGRGSCVTLHPDGFKTYNVPGLLTAASPQDTFHNLSQRPYHWLDEPPDPRHFTLTCWFYWPLVDESALQDGNDGHKMSVLVQSSPPDYHMQIYVDYQTDPQGVWTLVDHTRTKRPLKTPKLHPGWHMLALVSSTSKSAAQQWDGTRFYLDDWSCSLKNVWVVNDFYMVGNDVSYGGKKPFGLIADFRIYARCLNQSEIETMAVADGVDDHPDKIARKLAALDAATLLGQRLDVPDSAAECLRALGSLATLSSQRAKIFAVCGKKMLRLLESPIPMVQRQASRLMNNLA
mmetsp:Transcript_42460/g.76298  ORF Transcript_42460/g.76298 Transcript_42460/m.76298 type:complete len:1084 (-) Transcript_42460:23-3274(-)|eukprot:CAMPEP_0197632764 /NCGR_PEP_ID=MMETSP1338-20131121/9353_1 /TAXON_ID=43686 ORGANISM="Pelagodinium beii, Strain RCC1491" /NCGR_SAMPLE_ID=MMETSP1338 /ASSEMBLY_ACC=CAM_ASM_000754 /LENGTH=1083 /DNA_ID=CAMNT_0043204335 /DNA_START=79 /DNA_END=3330 /DNA_ORIENTATION=-